MAATAASLMIMAACTSFPELSLDEAASDAAPGSGKDGDDGPGSQGDDGSPGGDDATSTGGDASSTPDGTAPGKDATAPADAAPRDSAPPADAAKDAEPAACMAAVLDCTDAAVKDCPACTSACPSTQCTSPFSPACCAVETGNSGKYSACCYYNGAFSSSSCTKGCT